MRCDWIVEPNRKRRRLCNRLATSVARDAAGNWPQLTLMGLCDEHAELGRSVFHVSTVIEPEPYGVWLRAASWSVYVADRLAARLGRIARQDRYPYPQPEPLDYTAELIYRRARSRLADARYRLDRIPRRA